MSTANPTGLGHHRMAHRLGGDEPYDQPKPAPADAVEPPFVDADEEYQAGDGPTVSTRAMHGTSALTQSHETNHTAKITEDELTERITDRRRGESGIEPDADVPTDIDHALGPDNLNDWFKLQLQWLFDSADARAAAIRLVLSIMGLTAAVVLGLQSQMMTEASTMARLGVWMTSVIASVTTGALMVCRWTSWPVYVAVSFCILLGAMSLTIDAYNLGQLALGVAVGAVVRLGFGQDWPLTRYIDWCVGLLLLSVVLAGVSQIKTVFHARLITATVFTCFAIGMPVFHAIRIMGLEDHPTWRVIQHIGWTMIVGGSVAACTGLLFCAWLLERVVVQFVN